MSDKTLIEIDFGSMSELVAYLKSRPAQPKSASRDKRHGWSGGSFKYAMQLAEHGWPDGAQQARAMSRDMQIAAPMEPVHSGTFHDVTGSYVDVGEYVQGIPECMVDFRPDRRKARVANIRASTSFHAGIPADYIMRRGVAIAALVDALEAQSIRCSVELMTHIGTWQPNGSGKCPTLAISVMVKEPQDILVLDALVYGLGHPTFLRRLLFGVMELLDDEDRDAVGAFVGRGYGHPKNVPEIADTIHFDTMFDYGPWHSNEAALERIQKEYDKELKIAMEDEV